MSPDGSVFLGLVLATLVGTVRSANWAAGCAETLLRPPACTPPCTGCPCVCWQVLMQEVYMPGVSTQRLYLPCPAPPTGSWQANLADSLDTSALAQSILARLRRVGLDV